MKFDASEILELKKKFKEDGFLLLKNFYSFDNDIFPIQQDIMKIISAVCMKNDILVKIDTPADAMNIGYPLLIAKNRSLGGVVYDAVKQIPGFLRLVAKKENQEIVQMLRDDCVPGIAAGGYGIRIDNPSEEKFRAQWHQEFPAQLRSLDGIVFWSPLVPVLREIGPVQMAVGSHKGGPLPVYRNDKGVNASNAYALHVHDIEKHLKKYDIIAPLTSPTDLILMDFQLLHQSGTNESDQPRWSMQFRYFNFLEPVGQRINWAGSFAAGLDFAEILPELVV